MWWLVSLLSKKLYQDICAFDLSLLPFVFSHHIFYMETAKTGLLLLLLRTDSDKKLQRSGWSLGQKCVWINKIRFKIPRCLAPFQSYFFLPFSLASFRGIQLKYNYFPISLTHIPQDQQIFLWTFYWMPESIWPVKKCFISPIFLAVIYPCLAIRFTRLVYESQAAHGEHSLCFAATTRNGSPPSAFF